MNYRSPSEPVNELQEMILLAETVTQRVDELNKLRESLSMRRFFAVALVYTVLMGATAASLFFEKIYGVIEPLNNFGFWITLIFGGVGVVFSMGWAARINATMRSTNRAISRELSIQERVISLIDEQIRRLRHSGELTYVALATIEVKLAMLNRSNG